MLVAIYPSHKKYVFPRGSEIQSSLYGKANDEAPSDYLQVARGKVSAKEEEKEINVALELGVAPKKAGSP